MNSLRLTEIWIYPIKSMGGIRVPSAKVAEKGLMYDRRWMLIDSENNFITQREHHSMAFFKINISAEGFEINFKSDFSFLPFQPPLEPTHIQAKIWDDEVIVQEVNITLSNWFSKKIGIDCKLVQFPEANSRLIDARYRIKNENVSLADGYPMLIIGQSSMDDLNARMTSPLPMHRFRPNLVFTGGKPYEEDTWRNFSVGKNRMIGVKPCARCVLTTVDQQTAQAGKEPLATLATYRRKENKIYFGQNVIAVDYDEIFEGDFISLG